MDTMTAKSYAKARKSAGLKYPLPAGILEGNLMSVSTGPDHARRILRAHLDLQWVAIFLLCECADLDLLKEVEDYAPDTFWVFQPGAKGSAESGTAIIVRRSRGHLSNMSKVLGSAAQEGIRDRWIVRADVVLDPRTPNRVTIPVASGHNAPRRAPNARAAFMPRFSDLAAVKGADLNLTAAELKGRHLGGVPHTSGVLTIVVPPRFRSTGGARVVSGKKLNGADHDAVGLTLWPTTSWQKPRAVLARAAARLGVMVRELLKRREK